MLDIYVGVNQTKPTVLRVYDGLCRLFLFYLILFLYNVEARNLSKLSQSES